jgi:hypothetical protein
LATGVADVQEPPEPVPSTDEVQPTDGVEPIMETVEVPTPMNRDQTPEDVGRVVRSYVEYVKPCYTNNRVVVEKE